MSLAPGNSHAGRDASLRLLGVLLDVDVRVLDGQAPDVEVVADGDDDVNNEATVDAQRGAEHEEDKGHLVDVITERAGPAEADVLDQVRAERVDDAERERQTENVPVGEGQLHKVGGDHLADAVGVDEAGEQGKGYEVVVQDVGLQVQIGNDEGPDAEEGDQAEQRVAGALTAGAARAQHVEGRLDGVEDEDDAALDEVPLGEGQLVDERRDAERGGHAQGAQHALLPEVRATHVARQGVDTNQDEDALDGAVDDAESERLGVVLIPGLDVESEESCGAQG